MNTVTVLDRLIHKPVTLTLPETVEKDDIDPGDFIVYTDSDGNDNVGEYLGYTLSDAKKEKFKMLLEGTEKKNFDYYQEEAEKLFTIFSKEFCKEFPDAVTLCGRESVRGDQVYFYFYADQRYNFADFVRSFRNKLQKRFFIYQVSSRDRVRLHPNRDEWFDASGLPLMYSIFRHPLKRVESSVIQLQNLQWRDSQRLKDRSNKFDHTLNFEKEFYEKESTRYPERWSTILYKWKEKLCIDSNILTQEIKLRGKTDDDDTQFDGDRLVISLDEYEEHAKLHQASKHPDADSSDNTENQTQSDTNNTQQSPHKPDSNTDTKTNIKTAPKTDNTQSTATSHPKRTIKKNVKKRKVTKTPSTRNTSK